MPLEGHWERQHAGLGALGRRELRALGAGLAALGTTAAVLAIAAIGSGAPHAAAGCVDVVTPSTTGAATLHACGATARGWCRAQAGRGDAVAGDVRAACRRAGLPSP
jgi:hypothetical protein